MTDYILCCRFKDAHDRQHLTAAQIARELRLHPQTLAKWLAAEKFQPGRSLLSATMALSRHATDRRHRRADLYER